MSRLVPKLRFKEFSGEWEEKKLGEIGELVSGLTYSPDDVRDSGLLVLRSSNVQESKITLDDTVYVRTDIKGANLSKPNDILICVRNGSKALIGKNALIPNNMPLCTHGAFMTIFRSDISKFAYQLFQTNSYKKQVEADLGATINSINGNLLKKYIFYIPTPKEQQKIANTLSSLDALIEAQNQKVEALKKHKKGLMQQLFLSEGERVPKLRFKEFSGEWEEKGLEEVCSHFKGFAFKSKDYSTRGRRIIRVSDMGFDYIKETKQAIYIEESNAKLYEKWKLKQDDLIITTVGSKPPVYDSLVGRTIVVQKKDENSLLNQNAVCLRANSEIEQTFLNFLFKRKEYISFIESIIRGNANQGSIALVDLFKYIILIPKQKDEQQKIANTLSSLDALIEAQNQKVEALKEHKKGLMQQMFVSGEG